MNLDIFGWFTKDKVKVLEGIAKTIGKLFLGRLFDSAWAAIQDGVWRAEQTGKSGDEKFDMVINEASTVLKDKGTYRWVLSLLIEVAVGVLKASKGLI